MKFIIDDANVEAIKNLYEFFPVEGVTTNPSILAKAKFFLTFKILALTTSPGRALVTNTVIPL